MITVSIDTKPRDLRKMVEKLGRTFTKNHKRAMRRAAAEGVNRINKRTSLGLDVNEQPFRPYSDAYKGFRASKGRPVDKVKLIFTGRMRGAMTSGLQGQDGLIFFSSRAESRKAAQNNRTRPFFGLNKSDRRAIRDVYFKGLKI
jgi:hypothetical protein